MLWWLNNQILLFFNNLPHDDSFTLILAFLCWFGTVYAFSVPLYHLIFDKDKEDKIRAAKILGLLVGAFFTIRFFEKRFLDKILEFNTIHNNGYWSLINTNNTLINVEFHNPFPSFPSGHMLLAVGLGRLLYDFYNSLNTKLLIIVCVFMCAFIKLYMGMHTVFDLAVTCILVLVIYEILSRTFKMVIKE